MKAIEEEGVGKARIVWCNSCENYVHNLFNKEDDIQELPKNNGKDAKQDQSRNTYEETAS